MALPNYPQNPTLNQEFVVNNTTMKWDGEKWRRLSSSPINKLRDFTTTELINYSQDLPEGSVIETTGFYTSGDGGVGQWKATSTTGLVPNQYPADRGAAELVTGSGRLLELVAVAGTNKKEIPASALGAVGDGSTDNLPILLAAQSSGDILLDDGVYIVSDQIPLSAGRSWRALNARKATIKLSTTISNVNVFNGQGVDGVSIDGLTIDGGYNAADHVDGSAILLGSASSGNKVTNCYFTNVPNNTVLIRDGSNSNVVENCLFDTQMNGGTAHIYMLTNSDDNKVKGNHFNGSMGGCIWASGNCLRTKIIGNSCTESEYELIGIRLGCNDGEIRGNFATKTGDNGISVTGDNWTVTGNVCWENAFAGLALYGSRNTATGNVLFDNGKTTANVHGGLLIAAQFGGLASENVVSGNQINVINGDPSEQYYGIRVSNSSYAAWASGVAVTKGVYRTNENKLYEAVDSGTTGVVPPTHTSGQVDDGVVTWLYVGTFKNTSGRPDLNRVGMNYIGDHEGGRVKEFGETSNWFHDASAVKEFNSCKAWGEGQGVQPGQYVHHYRSDGVARHYRAKNNGTTGATAPTHNSGIVSDGGIDWLYVGESEYYESHDSQGDLRKSRQPLQIECLDTVNEANAPAIFSGTFFPQGVVSAANGSLYLRNTGSYGIQIYIKTGVNGSVNGWVALQMRESGATGSRPTAIQAGQFYFDTTLGKPIWYDGSQWVDATGAVV